MKSNWWLRFGCFVIGYNYELLEECGEASRKSVKKYTSAMLIVIIIWIANGYNFATIYVKKDNIFAGLVSALICSIIIVQIERQIILTMKPNKSLKRFRVALALLMALVGSVIIDQILFRQDLEDLRRDNQEINKQNARMKEQDLAINENDRNRKIYQIRGIDSISGATRERLNKLSGNKKTEKFDRDTINGKLTINKTFGEDIDQTALSQSLLISLENDKKSKSDLEEEISKLDSKKNLINEIYNKNKKPVSNGFLGEIQLLFNFLWNSDSKISLFVYFFWFILLFILEMLVLIAKSNDDHSDYERRVMFELDNNNKKIDFLSKRSDDNLR